MSEAEKIVEEIKALITKNFWDECYIFEYDYPQSCLTIALTDDFIYYHNLEIKISGVVSVYGYFGYSFLKTLEVQEHAESKDSAMQFIINKGLIDELKIFASGISYNTDTVFYYDRPDLKENERIAVCYKGLGRFK